MFGKNKPTILMVEDNRNNHLMFTTAFEEAGFDVTIAQNAEEGFVERVATLKPDIISMDIMIGKSGADLKVGGLEALAMLKQDERTKKIPVMMLTHFYEDGKIDRAKELGAVDFLTMQSIRVEKLPEYFKSYLKAPRRYKAIHPAFR